MNIHILIETYKKIPKSNIVIISNWNISEYGRKLYAKNINRFKNIILLNAIYDSNELDTIRINSNLYIHTHSLCGTAPSLVEAMSSKLPVICYDVPANRFTTENKAFYFKDVSSLTYLLNKLNNNLIDEIKNNMSEIATRRYTWERIAKMYQALLT